jgi:hypothetical protein
MAANLPRNAVIVTHRLCPANANARRTVGRSSKRAVTRMSKFKLGVLLGVVIGLAVSAAFAVWLLRDPIPTLSREAFTAAVARWKEKNPKHYDMQVVFTGGQTGTYQVEVRHGEVTRLVRDGQPLNRGAAWKLWTVSGMFEILEADLARMENPAEHPGLGEVQISAEFDGQWGYPRRYRQIQLGGKQATSEWQITQFSPAAEPAAAPIAGG